MNPTKINGANRTFGAPRDWDESKNGPCMALPVLDDGQALHSVWRPDAAELAALNRGSAVVLTIHGRTHPVVSVGVSADSYNGEDQG